VYERAMIAERAAPDTGSSEISEYRAGSEPRWSAHPIDAVDGAYQGALAHGRCCDARPRAPAVKARGRWLFVVAGPHGSGSARDRAT
jgi:hypothetical protein